MMGSIFLSSSLRMLMRQPDQDLGLRRLLLTGPIEWSGLIVSA